MSTNTEYSDRLRAYDWVVRPISLSTAQHLIAAYHYARRGSNTATYCFGLFRKGEELLDAMCLGVSWWIPSTTKSAAISVFPEGDWRRVLNLSRLVVAPDVPKNAASFLLARSIRQIDHRQWHCLVTYADQAQGHRGTIYHATNWEYLGLTKPEPFWVDKSGRRMSRKRGPRTLTREQLQARGYTQMGASKKHRFRMVLFVPTTKPFVLTHLPKNEVKISQNISQIGGLTEASD